MDEHTNANFPLWTPLYEYRFCIAGGATDDSCSQIQHIVLQPWKVDN